MKIEFELTVKIRGASLDEIDNGLIQAAGQRLMARMSNPPSQLMQRPVATPPPPAPQPTPPSRIHFALRAHDAALATVGKKEMSHLLSGFGVKKVQDLAEGEIDKFIQCCNTILEGKK